MIITYIGHSGFLVESEKNYLLFDYFEGSLPAFDKKKQLLVFVSHSHQDHYNRAIWNLRKEYSNISYIVSKEVPLSAGQREKLGLSEEDMKNVLRVKPGENYKIFDDTEEELLLTTLLSTDSGVAFLIKGMGKVIFHAGDLNLWTWEGERESYNIDMKKRFLHEMDKLRGLDIDVAFFPIDPRQEGHTGLGFHYLMQTVNVKVAFPMHFWGRYNTITDFIKKQEKEEYIHNVILVEKEGQSFLIE